MSQQYIEQKSFYQHPKYNEFLVFLNSLKADARKNPNALNLAFDVWSKTMTELCGELWLETGSPFLNTSEPTQAAEAASDLSKELDSLLEMANDYLSSQKEGRFAPCNPDFLIKHLTEEAKRLQEYEKRLLWLAGFIADSTHDAIIDVFGECYTTTHVIQNIDDAMADRI